MTTVRGIGLGAGLFVAATLTATLIAILYFGWTVIGLPFAPFVVFDWLTRVLPGRVIALAYQAAIWSRIPPYLNPRTNSFSYIS